MNKKNTLNVIDVSSWQEDINMMDNKDHDGNTVDAVIVKATEGTNYINPYNIQQYEDARANGLLLGVYHYLNGESSGKEEARHFLKVVKNHLTESILILDYEGHGNAVYNTPNELDYIKDFLNHVYNETGINCLIYCSESIAYKFDMIGNHGLWLAKYPYNNQDDNPRTFSNINHNIKPCAMYQFTNNIHLNGRRDGVDGSVFYGDANAWKLYAKPSTCTVDFSKDVNKKDDLLNLKTGTYKVTIEELKE